MTRTPIPCRLKLYKYDFYLPSGRRITDSIAHEPRVTDELRIDGLAVNEDVDKDLIWWILEERPQYFLLAWRQSDRDLCDCTLFSFDADTTARVAAFLPSAVCKTHDDLQLHFCSFSETPQRLQSWLLPRSIERLESKRDT